MICEFLTGSYASPEEEGICRFRLDTERGKLEKLWGVRGLRNPSWILLDKRRNILYAVRETVPEGAVAAFRMEPEGIRLLNELESGGADPCHLSLADKGRLLLAANYTGGSLAAFSLKEDGSLEKRVRLAAHHGAGPDPVRQEAAHVHFSEERDGILYVTDLGQDRVFRYHPDERLAEADEPLLLPPGSGPRHLAFRDDMLYVLCELAGETAVFRRTEKGYALCQRLSMLPSGFSGKNIASAIRISGDFLLTGNRGHDSLALCRIGEDGELSLLDIVPCGGKTPRDFALMGDYVLTADQDSDCICVLRLDRKRGRLEDTGIRAGTARPSCICPA